MIFREATIADIPQLMRIRNAVKENSLSDPSLVPHKDYETYLTVRGNGWLCEINGQVTGFSIADLVDNNIWAFFVDAAFEGKGIGQKLHNLMLDWYFSQTRKTVWLGTAFNTRAEQFYRLQGWQEAGIHGSKEIKFEMTCEQWRDKRNPSLITDHA